MGEDAVFDEVDAGTDLGTPARDLGIADGVADLVSDGPWPAPAGWEMVESAECPLYMASNPDEAYPIRWEPCEDDQPCEAQVLDSRYDAILAKRLGQRAAGAPLLLGFFAFEDERERYDAEYTYVLASPDEGPHAAWLTPRREAVGDSYCLVSNVGTNGHHAAVEILHLDSMNSVLFHDSLSAVHRMELELGRLTRAEQLANGIQQLNVSRSHTLAFMGALVWAFGSDGSKQRRGGPLDGLGAPWVFGSTSTLVGPNIMAILEARQIAAFSTPDAEPTALYEPRESIRLSGLTDDGVHMAWVQRDLDADTWELWGSPHTTSPGEVVAERLTRLESAGLPVVGDGIVAIVQSEQVLLVVDIVDGRVRRFEPPTFGFRPFVYGVTAREVFLSGSIDGESRYLRVAVDALPYD